MWVSCAIALPPSFAVRFLLIACAKVAPQQQILAPHCRVRAWAVGRYTLCTTFRQGSEEGEVLVPRNRGRRFIMQVKDVMTREAECIAPDTTLQEAARK